MTDTQDPAAVLAEAAEWFYHLHDLWEDRDLDPDDHLAVVQRAFTSSDCDDFAAVINRMTGWPVVRATWTLRGGAGFGHHAMVRAPDGGLVDVTGPVDEATLRKRYKAKSLALAETVPDREIAFGNVDDVTRICRVVRALPYAPFDTPGFRALSATPLAEEVEAALYDAEDARPSP